MAVSEEIRQPRDERTRYAPAGMAPRSARRRQNFMEVQHIVFAADFLDFARVRPDG